MQKGSSDRYFRKVRKRVSSSEGIEGRVPYRGPIEETLFQMIGGLRRDGVPGSATIEALRTKVDLFRSHRLVSENLCP